jgi:2-keto-4-pentenoate hydratase/2-oxohepta-3-ene-1,7-dioic acid hydratase in catechol pathway
MRVTRVGVDSQIRTAVVEKAEDRVLLLPTDVSVIDALTTSSKDSLLATAEPRPLGGVDLLAPIVPPSIRDFSVFEQHIEGIMLGLGTEIPKAWYESPFCYFSNPGAVTGPGEDIEIPPGCAELDLELEIAVIVGRAGRNIKPEDAGDYIAGYTIFNDWSARDLQFEEMTLGLGTCKGKDFANTLGPWIVSSDELEPYRNGDRLDIGLTAKVNGRQLGDDTLANMAWSFEELISYASRGTWLRPGDVIGSGTCGFGALLEVRARQGAEDNPYLKSGDVIELTAEGIGTLTNRVVAGVDRIDLPPARPGRLRSRAAA